MCYPAVTIYNIAAADGDRIVSRGEGSSSVGRTEYSHCLRIASVGRAVLSRRLRESSVGRAAVSRHPRVKSVSRALFCRRPRCVSDCHAPQPRGLRASVTTIVVAVADGDGFISRGQSVSAGGKAGLSCRVGVCAKRRGVVGGGVCVASEGQRINSRRLGQVTNGGGAFRCGRGLF